MQDITRSAGKSEVPAGRPSIYSDLVAEMILDRLASGDSLVQICKGDDMPSLRTVMRWAADNPNFGTEYALAREAQAEIMDDMILTAAAEARGDPQAARVRVEAYKWRAGKLSPKRFGDATTLKHADADGNSLPEIDDTARAIRLAAIINTIGKSDADNAG